MEKKWLIFTGAIILVTALTTTAFATSPIKLIINGQEIKPDVSPQIINGRTMVPIRWVAEAFDADVQWDEQNSTVNINKTLFVTSLPEATVKLYPFQEFNEMYDGFVLEINEKRKYFDWKNLSAPNWKPQLLFADLNQNGEKELIIILTIATGTGLHQEEIHVIDPKKYIEIDVENPSNIIKQKVNTKIVDKGNNVEIHIIIGNQEITVNKEKGYASEWFNNVYFGNIYRYQVINNEILVSIPAQVSPAGFIGDLQVTYDFQNSKYRAKTIEFKPY